MKRNNRAIVVENQTFATIKEAAEAFKLKPQSLYQALHHNRSTINGYKVGYSVKTINAIVNNANANTSTTNTKLSFNGDKEALKAFRLQKMREGKRLAKSKKLITSNTTVQTNSKAKNNKSVPVKCMTTEKIYNSISEAAKDAGTNMWTMSLKMEQCGKFIDKNGNVYIRLKPMVQRTTRKYSAGPANVSRVYTHNVKNESVNETTKNEEVSLEDKIVQTLIESANLLASAKKYSKAADVFNILASLEQK